MSSNNCVYSIFAVFIAATLASGATIVHSDQTVMLSELLNGQTLTVGDKTFGEFAYSKVGDMPEPTDVNVIPIVADGDNGIRFQGGFIDLVGGGVSDSLITFSVSAPSPLINGARLYGNSSTPGGGIATVTETFLPTLPNTILTISAGINLEDSTSFAPLQKLVVQKDILLVAGTEPATLTFVDQTFPQVPEPSAALMSIFGVLGLLSSRRGRN